MVQYACIDKLPRRAIKDIHNSKSLRSIFQKNAIWSSGSNGKITITFEPQGEPQAWSQIGKESNGQTPSMMLNYVDPPWKDFTFDGTTYKLKEFKDAIRNWCNDEISDCDPRYKNGCTVQHEFLHSLGFLHELGNNLYNSNSVKLDPERVKSYYIDRGMTAEDAQVNVLDKYECHDNSCEYEGSIFDPDSIMLYCIPDDWLVPGTKNPTKLNCSISNKDREWLQREYPISSVNARNYPVLNVRFIDNNPKMWMVAWTQQTLKENLFPIVGVIYHFTYGSKTWSYYPVEIPTVGPTLPTPPIRRRPRIKDLTVTEKFGQLDEYNIILITCIIIGIILLLLKIVY